MVVPTGNWVVVLKTADPTLGTMKVTGVSVTSATVIDFQFDPAVTISGLIYQEDGTTPIVGADVNFTGITTGANGLDTTDGTGRYTVSLVPDTYEVVVTPNDAMHLKQRFTVVVSAASNSQHFTLTLGITVFGVVQTNLGVPLLDDANIEVVLPESSAFFPPASIQASAVDGSYSIPLVPPGTVTFEIEASGDTGFPRQRITRTISGPVTETEDFALAIGYVLSGTILQDDAATPEANVEVKPIPNDGSLPPDTDDTDGAGQYEISLFPGIYDVEIIPETANLQLPEVRTIAVVDDTVLDLTLTRGVVLSGTVTEPGTPPVGERAQITWSGTINGLSITPSTTTEGLYWFNGTHWVLNIGPGSLPLSDGTEIRPVPAPVGTLIDSYIRDVPSIPLTEGVLDVHLFDDQGNFVHEDVIFSCCTPGATVGVHRFRSTPRRSVRGILVGG